MVLDKYVRLLGNHALRLVLIDKVTLCSVVSTGHTQERKCVCIVSTIIGTQSRSQTTFCSGLGMRLDLDGCSIS